MMFLWDPKKIEFMTDAYDFNNPYKDILRRISPFLQGAQTVCDAGCGLGYLSLALSDSCEHVTAVDIAPEPLLVLKKKIMEQKYNNIEVLEGDINLHAPSKPYDAMVFCLFGELLGSLKYAKQQCGGKIIMVSRNEEFHRFTLSQKPVERDDYRSIKSGLEALGIPFYSEEFSVEMGQPFKTVEAAVEFFQCYRREDYQATISIEEVMAKLTKIDSDVFPYYLEKKRALGILVIDAKGIPDEVGHINHLEENK